MINEGANFIEKDKMGNDSLDFGKEFAKDQKVYALLFKQKEKIRIKQDPHIFLNITRRINNMERDIAYFEQKK